MPKTILGKVSLTPRGEWIAEQTYEPLDVVVHQGSSYIVLKNITGETPLDNKIAYALMAAKGNEGEKGEPGEPGIKGEQGMKGDHGTKGDQGDAGAQGTQGTKGDQGTQGMQGEQGIQGMQGTRGEKGDKGERGDKGRDGEQGEKGDAGKDGVGVNILGELASIAELPVTGERGDGYLIGGVLYVYNPLAGGFVKAGNIKGPKGEKGDGGERGEKGDKGGDGATFSPHLSEDGTLSFTNNMGLPNPDPINIKGMQGLQGIQGKQGIKGDQGIQGIQGAQGIPGENIGIEGPEGKPGAKGDPFLYEDFTPEQLASLKGEDGSPDTKAEIITKLNQPGEVTLTQHWSFSAGVANTSDMRFKRNVAPVSGVLDRIAGLSVFKYNWEDEDGNFGRKRIGISAQEMEERFPEVVDEMDDGRKTKTVDMQSQIAILFAAVKELAEENRVLKQSLGR